MKNCTRYLLAFVGLFSALNSFADNPIIVDQFSADPTARMFEGKIYVYPSHDILATPGRGRAGWFNMEDYHVYSSENLMDWQDHGVILTQETVPWTNPTAYAMWAPDCVYKNGKYYFYFPAPGKPMAGGARGRRGGGGGSRIGVAIADKPYGPFKPEPQAIAGVGGIDPGVLIDKDGKAYMFWSGIMMAKLKDNMVELDGPVQRVANLPTPGLIEGPFPFERNGKYYLTFPHVQNTIERLEYMMADKPMGPYKWAGVILDESASKCWTVHHSLVEYKGQWYLFYHDRDLSPNFDKARSVRADYLYFNPDGTIKKVIPTLRGIGIADARRKIQIDRYSEISKEGVADSYLNTSHTQEGWKVSLKGKNTWVKYDRVDFGKGGLKSVNARAISPAGGSVELHLDKVDGPLVAKVEFGKDADWKVVNAKLASDPSGQHDLVVTHNDDSQVDLDWVSFE